MINTIALVSSILKISRPTFNLKLFYFFVFASFVSVLLFYIFQVNSYTREKYLLMGQQNKIQILSGERENLEINFSRFNSLANIGDYIASRGFEKAQKPTYIQILENPMAKK